MKIAIPAAPAGTKIWHKILTGIAPEQQGGYALEGFFLEPGATYDVPPGALLVSYSKPKTGDDYTVTLTLTQSPRPDTSDDQQTDTATHDLGELPPVKTWTNKRGKIGPQIITGLAAQRKRLKPPALGQADVPRLQDAPPRRNERDDTCMACRGPVPAGEGVLVRDGDRTRVRHTPHCPPRRNQRAEPCRRCRVTVPPGQGRLYLSGGAWYVEHLDTCPTPDPADQDKSTAAPTPPRRRPNRKPGTCRRCLQHVPADAGVLKGGPGAWRVEHDGDCPPHPLNPDAAPTWTITQTDEYGAATPTYRRPGTVVRLHLTTRQAQEQPPPADAPGLTTTQQGPSFIALVVASDQRRELSYDTEEWYDVVTTVWRAATAEEATDRLALEATRARRAELADRTRNLLHTFRYPHTVQDDATTPTRQEMDGVRLRKLPRVPLPAGVGSPAPYESECYLDEPAGIVWTLAHNGLDGDDWSPNNLGGWIATRHPLTEQRRELINDLYAEYGTPNTPAPEQ